MNNYIKLMIAILIIMVPLTGCNKDIEEERTATSIRNEYYTNLEVKGRMTYEYTEAELDRYREAATFIAIYNTLNDEEKKQGKESLNDVISNEVFAMLEVEDKNPNDYNVEGDFGHLTEEEIQGMREEPTQEGKDETEEIEDETEENVDETEETEDETDEIEDDNMGAEDGWTTEELESEINEGNIDDDYGHLTEEELEAMRQGETSGEHNEEIQNEENIGENSDGVLGAVTTSVEEETEEIDGDLFEGFEEDEIIEYDIRSIEFYKDFIIAKASGIAGTYLYKMNLENGLITSYNKYRINVR